MIVVGADEGVDADQAVVAGAVFHDHRLSRALGQAVRQQPRANIGAAARPERHDEFDRPRRPIGCRCRSGANQGGKNTKDDGTQDAKAHDLLPFALTPLPRPTSPRSFTSPTPSPRSYSP